MNLSNARIPANLTMKSGRRNVLARKMNPKRFAYIVCFLWVVCTPAWGQSLDAYGGRTDLKCSRKTGWFRTEKINNRWWLCTPDGNAFFFEGVGAWQSPGGPKYGNSKEAGAASLIDEFQSWGFNAVGELSYGPIEPVSPCRGCKRLPEIQTIHVSNYAAANLWNYAQRPMKNLLWGLNGHYTGWRASIMDFFEPQFRVWVDRYFKIDSSFAAYKTSPYFVGVLVDDTDWFWGMGAGPDFHTIPEGHSNSHVGYMVLITSPIQTYNPDPASRGIPELYTDTKVYSKTAMANPPANCSVQTPCSLREYLFKKYSGSIAALNAAWGSNYTTFDSSGMQVQGELVGTGDGTTKVFTHTLANAPVSPHSVALKVGGKLEGGDCQGCGVQSGGAITGPQGAAIAVGIQPWLRDPQITKQDCGGKGCSLPPASYWVRTTWHGCISSPSRTIGNTYPSGNPQITVTTNNATPPPRCSTGVDIYVSCRLQSSSTPAYGCLGEAPGNTEPPETLQASNVALNTGSWTEPVTGLVAGPAIPPPPSFVEYSNGQIQITFSSAPSSGRQITVDYVANGWEFGTGLMDEDGRNKAWVGTNPICLSPATACDGHDFPKANANPHLAADLDGWVSQFSAQYFGTVNAGLKAAAPHMIYLGADTVGTWGAPARKGILEGAAPYVDALFTLWYGNLPDPKTSGQIYTYLTQYLGDKPLLNFMTLNAQPDSAMSQFPASAEPVFPTQTLRGQQWDATLSDMLNTPSFNHTYQWVGIVWWGSHDFTNSEKTDWGLKTPLDNAYDGHEAGVNRVPCSPPLEKYSCGGEKRDYGDLITWIRKANHRWLEVAGSNDAGVH